MRLSTVACLAGGVAATTDCTFAASYPRQYVAYASDSPPVFDGRLDEPFWQDVGFSEAFVDISTNATPGKQTRVKLRWDDAFLYIGAFLVDDQVWANITSTCHCLDPTHDQVIYHDNDFEVFVDADGSTHGYKETEVNAAAASWDLLLQKPYNDGGSENSSRVFGPAGWDMFPPAHVSTFVTGTLNDPSTPHTFWTAELALPLSRLVDNTTALAPPAPGSIWRINFSRVEWGVSVVGGKYWLDPSCTTCPVPGTGVEDNWVWSPQGSIAMHLPEMWGMLQFATGPVNGTAPVRNPEWPVRSVAMALYYAQHAYAASPTGGNGTYAADVAQLLGYTPDPHVLDGTCSRGAPVVTLGPGGKTFTGGVVSLDGALTANVTDDRYLRVYPGGGA